MIVRIRWTSAQDAVILDLWPKGVLADAIGKRLGVSKSAVVGRVHRLGLSIRREGTPRAVVHEIAAPAPKGCAFPLWNDTERPTMVFCGETKREGSSYCAKHHKICWIKPAPLKVAVR